MTSPLEWEVHLAWPGGEALLGPADLAVPPGVATMSELYILPSPRRTWRCVIALALAAGRPSAGEAIQAALDGHLPVRATLRDAQENPIARALLRRAERVEGRTFLRFEQHYPGSARLLCRRLHHAFPGAPTERRPWLPQVFGTMELSPVPLFDTQRANLAGDLEEEDGALFLREAVDWPQEGLVQVRDEILVYQKDPGPAAELTLDGRTDGAFHPAGAGVHLLPALLLQWCLADHPATAISVRLDHPRAPGPVAGEVKGVSANGRTAAVLEREGLPLRVLHGHEFRERRIPHGPAAWTLDGATNALSPNDAFPAAVDTAGAVLAHGSEILEAHYIRDERTGGGRFDRIVSLHLEFEFSETAAWEEEGQLLARVWKDTEDVSLVVTRGARIDEAPVTGGAQTPDKGAAFYRRWWRLGLQRLLPTGPWTAVETAIDGTFQQGAELDDDNEAALRGLVLEAPPGLPAEAEEIRLRARIQNRDAQEPVSIRLRLKIGGTVLDFDDQAVPAGQTTVLGFTHVPSAPVPAALYATSEAGYDVELPDGGDVVVEEFWVEVLGANPPAPPKDSADPLPIEGKAVLPAVFHRAGLDVTPLLDGAAGMHFLSPEGSPPRVRFELMGSSPGTEWTVRLRDVHWRMVVHPATSVEPVERLRAVVEGRPSNPARAVEDVLADPLHGALAPEQLDAATFDAAAAVSTQRGLAFGVVHAGVLAVGSALERALAESFLRLVWQEGRWRLDPVPLDSSEITADPLPAGAILQPGTREILEVGPEAPPPAMALLETGWLAGGGGQILDALAARAHPASHTVEFASPASMTAWPVGSNLELPEGLQGEVELSQLEEGRLTIRLAMIPPTTPP